MNTSFALPDFHMNMSAHPRISRNVLVIGTVLVLHVAALWAMQSGLLRRAVEVVITAEVLSELIDPPRPKVAPPPPQPAKVQATQRKAVTPPAPPQLMAVKDAESTPNAPTGVTTPQPPLPPITAPVQVSAAPVAAPAAPPVPPKVELPSSDADYLQNPRPAYPSQSTRLGEQGKVPVRGLILSSPALMTRAAGGLVAFGKVMAKVAPNMAMSNQLQVEYVARDLAVVDAYRKDPLVHPTITPRLFAWIVNTGKALREAAQGWKTQTLVLFAGADRLVDPAGARAFVAALPTGIGVAHEYPAFYHEIFNDPEKDAPLGDLEAWLMPRI